MLMLGVPKSVAATGCDAFVQAIEPYVSVDHNPITDSQCKEAIQLIQEALPEAVANGQMLKHGPRWLKLKCWPGWPSTTPTWVTFMLAHQLGGQYDAPHGVCCALLLTTVEEYNLIAAQIGSPNWPGSWVTTPA